MVAARHAADQIAVRRTGALREMGSTVAMLRVTGDRAVIAHVGDSRVYRLRGRALAQLTIDHSLAAELEKSGARPEANFAWRHVVTRALGTATAEPEVQSALVTGARPFAGETPWALRDAIHAGASLLAMPADLAAIATRALAFDARDRFPSIDDLRCALAAAQRQRPPATALDLGEWVRARLATTLAAD